jgi:Glycosyl transferase family 2
MEQRGLYQRKRWLGLVCLCLGNFVTLQLFSSQIKMPAEKVDVFLSLLIGPTNPGARPSAVRAYSRPKMNQTAAICAVGKHEAPYIDEWTDYHLALGFSSIYVYDNTDRFELEQWGHDRHERGENVFVVHNPGWSSQCKAYYNCANSTRSKGHTWALFIDLDEFLILKKHSHVVDFASEYVEHGHLGMNWRLFGTSDRQNYEPIPVTKRFQYRVHEDYQKNTAIKSFVRLEDMNLSRPCFDPHFFPRKVGTYLKDTDGTKFNSSRHRGPTNVAVIYHYYFKSKEEYISKRSRGAGHLGYHESLVNEAIAGRDPVNRTASIPNGTIFDDTAWQMIKKMVPKYALYDKFLQ